MTETTEAVSQETWREHYIQLINLARDARAQDCYNVENEIDTGEDLWLSRLVTEALGLAERIWVKLPPEQQATLNAPWLETANGLKEDPHWS